MKTDRWWVARLDALKDRHRLTDVALSRRIGISPAMLAHVRAGRNKLPPASKVRLLDALGYVLTRDVLLSVLPAELKSALLEVDHNHAQHLWAQPEPDPNAGLESPPGEI